MLSLSIAQKVGLAVLVLASFALAQAGLRIFDAQASLERGEQVIAAMPDRTKLGEIEQLLEADTLQIYALLASSKRVRGKALAPLMQELDARAAQIESATTELRDAEMRSRMQGVFFNLGKLREMAIAEFQKSAMVRDIAAKDQWLSGAGAVLATIKEQKFRKIPNEVVLDAHMQRLLSSSALLNNAGQEFSQFAATFGGFITSRGHLNAQTAASFAQTRAGFLQTVRAASADASIAGLFLDLDEAIQASPLFDIADTMARLAVEGGDRPEAATGETWFAEVALLRDALARTSTGLNDALVAHVNGRLDMAKLNRLVAFGIGLACLVLIALSTLVIRQGVLQPLARAIKHLDRLSTGARSIDIDNLPRSHEFGRLRQALERLVSISLENDALQQRQQEQDRAAQAAERARAERESKRLQEEMREARDREEALAQARAAESQAAQEIAEVVSACAAGDFSQRLETQNKEGVFAELCAGLNQIGASANEGLGAVQAALQHFEHGNLAYRMPEDFKGVFGDIANAVNGTAEGLADTIGGISNASVSVDNVATEIALSADRLLNRSQENAATLAQTAASVDQMATATNSAADTARLAREAVRKIAARAQEGSGVVGEAVAAMDEIKNSSAAIASILKQIDEIAFQTNLLALNAGVEAARAGPAGQGFAVVASEVRALAARSATAAQEISELIGKSADDITAGVSLVDRSGQELNEIVSDIVAVSSKIEDIHEVALATSTGFAEIATATKALDQSTQANVATFKETSAAADALQKEANGLSASVAQFELVAEDRFARSA